MTPDTKDDSAEYGIAPTVVGFAIAAILIFILFSMATGFA